MYIHSYRETDHCVCVCVQVNARERVVAERYYLTKYSSVWIDSQQESEVEKRLFEQAHPRYTELANGMYIIKCGCLVPPPPHCTTTVHNIPLEILRPTPSSGPLLKSCLLCILHTHYIIIHTYVFGPNKCAPLLKFVSWIQLLVKTNVSLTHCFLALTVRCPDQPEAKQLSKRLPSSMTVQKLKGLLQRVYTVNTTQQRLSYIDNTRGIEIEIDDNLKQLSYYSIQSGDIILLRW